MPVRAASLLPTAVAALVLSLPVAPAVAAKCRPGHDQRVIARSTRAVLLGATEPQWGYRLWGCSRRTGSRRLLGTGNDDRELKAPMLRGTHVGYIDAGLDGDDSIIISDAALRRGRRVRVSAVLTESLSSLRLGDDGGLAWRDTAAPGQRLRLWRPGDTTRLVDEGFDLTGLRFTGRTLHWRHDGAGRSQPPLRASVCTGRPELGSTTTVDIFHTNTKTVACWRATGALTTFAETLPAPVIAGSWIATVTDNSIEVRNLLDPTAGRSVHSGAVGGLIVDGYGSLGWTAYVSGSGHPPAFLSRTAAVWVDDATGTHSFGDVSIYDIVTLARDGSQLRWLVSAGDNTSGTATLVPRPTAGTPDPLALQPLRAPVG